MNETMENLIEQAVESICEADGLIIGAGAGMGVDSGLPDFRGQQGFWQAYPALAKTGLDFMSVSNPVTFARTPQLTWGFYGHRFNLYRNTLPHLGFQILKEIGEQLRFQYQVFTSNVDGHFQAAGYSIQSVYECHGSINYLQCATPCCSDIWPADNLVVETDDKNCLAIGELPRCIHCDGIARPNILMFNDYAWNSRRSNKQHMAMQGKLAMMSKPVVIECGAGTAIPTVRYFCEKQQGTLIRVNPRDYHFDFPQVRSEYRSIGIDCGALEALQAIYQGLKDNHFFSH